MSIDIEISIVVCSVNEALYASFEKKVQDTIGCNYELIRIENKIKPRGICEVYNEGAAYAKGKILCYCHEDILFDTMDWGNEIISLLTEEDIGLVGIAGAVFKSKYPTSWVAVPQKYYRVNMKQVKADGTFFYSKILEEGNYSEVAVLDGCFIAGRKNVFDTNRWNEEQLKGFHLYDLDISLQVKENYKLVVANNLSITHLSEGHFGLDWLKASEQYHAIRKDLLPASVKKMHKGEVAMLNYFGLNAFVNKLKELKQPRLKIFSFTAKAILLFPFKRQNLMMLKILFNSA